MGLDFEPHCPVLTSLLSALLLGSPQIDGILWSGEQVCPGAARELDAAIDSQFGDALEQGASLEIALRFEPGQGAGPQLDLSIVSEVGSERHELHGTSCAALLDQAALLIVSARDPFMFVWMPPDLPRELARPPIQRPRLRSSVPVDPVDPVDAEVVEPEPAELPAFDSSEPSVVAPTLAAEPPPSPRRRGEAPPTTGALGVAATGFVGLFPTIGGGAELEGALERGAFRWQLAGSGWFGGRFRASDGSIGGDLWALGLGTGLCGVPATRRVRFPLCAVGGVGMVAADAVGTLAARRSNQAWAWVGVEARVQVLVTTRFALGLGVGVQASLLRPGWSVSSPDAEFRLRPVTGILRLSGEFRGISRKSRSSLTNPRVRGQ